MLAREKPILATRALYASLNVLYWRCRQFDTGSRLADGLRHPSSAFVCNSSKEESGSSSSGTDAAPPHAAVESPTLPSTGTNGLGYTVSSLYIKKRDLPQFVELDHLARRRKRDTEDIIKAAQKLGLTDSAVRDNLSSLERLLPDLQPNLDRMRATEWAKLASDVDRVAAALVVLKSAYPCANISKVVSRTPKLLLRPTEDLLRDAAEVRNILPPESFSVAEVAAVMEAVPYLLEPRALLQSLGNLQRWFPSQDPITILKVNPELLINIEEADLEADPQYGELTTAG